MFDLGQPFRGGAGSTLWVVFVGFPLGMDTSSEETSALPELVFVLLTETVSSREEVPAALLVHLPHVRLLHEHTHTKVH